MITSGQIKSIVEIVLPTKVPTINDGATHDTESVEFPDIKGDEMPVIYVGVRSGVKYDAIYIGEDNTIMEYKVMVWYKLHGEEQFGMPLNDYLRVYHLKGRKNNQIYEDGRTFVSYGLTKSNVLGVPYEVTLNFTVNAGVNVIKKHLKKDDAIVAFRRVSKQKIDKLLDLDTDVTGDAPEDLRKLLNPIKEKMAVYKNMLDNGQEFTKHALEKLKDDQLDHLVEILGKKRGGLTEEKIVQLAHVMMPEVACLEECVPHINTLKLDLVHLFTDIYIAEYNTIRANGMGYDNEKLLTNAQAIINYRRGIRHMMSSSSEQHDVSGDSEGPGCSIA